ncbi:MAG: diaminopimelate epimerase, partial [Bacteroides sp.]|nr:diaminopimelate epimerase [Bacteroides sp.]
MIVHFSKYHGTGNDFIMIDGRTQDSSQLNKSLIHRLCDRRFGIGSDGFIILEKGDQSNLRMRYYNADGNEGTMCGNGGRCFTAFAHHLELSGIETTFEGIDGMHKATLLPDGDIRLKIKDVSGIKKMDDGYFMDTGSPHFVKFVTGLEQLDVTGEGREIRHQKRFGKEGVNVNFLEQGASPDHISVRTFERGVEAETYSCGTGVSAAAICSYLHHKSDIFTYQIHTLGGQLKVSFKALENGHFTEIYLTGPAKRVYEGSIEIKN